MATEEHETADTYFALAQAMLLKGDTTGAERVIRDAIAKLPAAPGLHLFLGRVLATRGEVAEGYYEMQWEVLRGGAAAADADRESAALQKARGKDGDEVRRLLTAMAKGERAVVAATRQKRGDRLALLAFEAACCLSTDPEAARSLLHRALDIDPHLGIARQMLVSLGHAGE